ncbi:unknown protein; 55998-51558 [Arabidopsis thaliana]|uniref:Uncharacterized protein F8D11.14 n=1 Tax=Arabidopsis thaliana TaxID=3702 RepID=Q9C849_ARATH|nr:unknown protein; 55998-51558 [Arabidopsis thaliana]
MFPEFAPSTVVAIDELRNLKDSLRIGDERDDVVDMAVVFYEVCILKGAHAKAKDVVITVKKLGDIRQKDTFLSFNYAKEHLEGIEDDTNDLDTRLPPRHFATDRYPDARLNIYSRPDILTVICDVLKGSKEMETIIDSCFGSLFSLRVSECPISGKLVHALLCRQLVTKQKYEMWTVFGGQPLRFSLVEFGSVTGLPCGEFPEEYEPDFFPRRENGTNDYWNVLIGEDKNATLADVSSKFQALKGIENPLKLPLALLLIVDGVLIANNQTHRPTFKYVKMLEDIDSFLAFPWGRESFLKTIQIMRHMTVIPMLSVNTNEDGWGEWDDEVRDKKISKCHNFTKKEWPGGYADLPLIYVNEKEPVVQHKKYIVIRKKKLSPTSSSKRTPSKTKVSTSTRGWKRKLELVDDDEAEDNDDEATDKANEGEDIKLWVKSQFSSIRHEFTESVKKLRSENLNLLKKIRLLQSYRSRPATHHPFKKHLPSPRPPAVFDTATKPSPNDVTEEIKSSDLSLAENVDTLLDTVCKNISSSVAASDEDDKKEDDQKDNDHKEDNEIENDDEEVEFSAAHLEWWFIYGILKILNFIYNILGCSRQ